MLPLLGMAVTDHWHSHGENQFVTVRPKAPNDMTQKIFQWDAQDLSNNVTYDVWYEQK